jgi:cardiolipin synthase
MLNLPNLLTLLRIIAIPFFLVLLSFELYLEALIVFIVSGLTDALDGAVARMTGQQTPLGSYLDPLADKLLVGCSYLMLAFISAIPPWLVVLVVSRDVIILLGYGAICLLVEERMVVQPSLVGKLNTVFQMVTVGVVLLFLHAPQVGPSWIRDAFVFVTGVTTVISGIQYLYRGLVWLQNRAHSLGRFS